MNTGLQRAWAVTLLMTASVASAQASTVVALEAVGPEPQVAALEASLRDWLRNTGLTLRRIDAFTQPGAEPVFARVRVVWSDAACTVELFRDDGELVRRRSLPREGAPVLVAEAAALVAQAGVQELLLAPQRQPLKPTETAPLVEAPAPEPEPVTPPSRFVFALGGFLTGRSYDARAPFVFGGGLEARGSVRADAWLPGLSLRVAYLAPVTRDSELARVVLQTLAFRLDAVLARTLGPVRVSLGAGGGFDVLLAQTSSGRVPPSTLTPSRGDVAPFIDAFLGFAWQPTSRSSLFLRVAADFDPAPRRYVAQVAGDTTTLLEPWRVRPSVLLGFSFDLVGGAR